MSAMAGVARLAADRGLLVMGVLPCDGRQPQEPVDGTMILLGTGPGFWPVYASSPEARDGEPDPVDRWSTRVVGAIARRVGAQAVFPFGGPPYAPFIDWAKRSGRAFASPRGMLVHDKVGLMISYRGALHLPQPVVEVDKNGRSPCIGCPAPCATACPVDALTAGAPYDIAACHRFLDSAAGKTCMMQGCAARRACPVSAGAERCAAQNALHMKAFHPA